MKIIPFLLLLSCAAVVTARAPSVTRAPSELVDAGAPNASLADRSALSDGGMLVLNGGAWGDEADTPAVEDDEAAETAAEGRAGDEPGEIMGSSGAGDAGWQYTLDLSDEALAKVWKDDLPALGSISMGFVQEGRLINGVPFPQDTGWTIVSPEGTYGTQETVDFVSSAIRQVRLWYPDAPPLRVNQISAREGGYLRPHKTHQNGRDVDLGFYYPGGPTVRVREREKVIDVALNWALVKALVIHGDVQFILVDLRVQKVLFDYAKKAGEDPVWLDSLFHAGSQSILQHARRHRDHFHVRYFNARAQELGVRVAPLLAQRPEENIAMHRVRRGDTLGGIAYRYGSSVTAIRKASGLSNTTLLRIGNVLKVPLRKPCTTCPVPPQTIVPPRRLPPGMATGAVVGLPDAPGATASAVPSASK
jgi:LysM repeat protein